MIGLLNLVDRQNLQPTTNQPIYQLNDQPTDLPTKPPTYKSI